MNILKQLDILNHIYNIITTNILSGYNAQLDYKYTSTIEFNSTPTLLISFDNSSVICLFNKNEQDNLCIQITTRVAFVCDWVKCESTQMLITYHKVKNKIEELLTQVKLNTNE